MLVPGGFFGCGLGVGTMIYPSVYEQLAHFARFRNSTIIDPSRLLGFKCSFSSVLDMMNKWSGRLLRVYPQLYSSTDFKLLTLLKI